jgi:hypothetical protein
VHSLAMNEECHSCSCSCSCCINQKRKSCKSALLITHKIDYQIVDKNKRLIITTVLQRWVSSLSQTEQTHRRFSWSSHRLTPIFSSATPLLTFFFFFWVLCFLGVGLGLQLDGSMQCSFLP